MIFKCPGQDKRNIKAEIIKCRSCGYGVEIFSDEIKIRCPNCQNDLSRQIPSTCLDWCKYAKECVGEETYANYLKNKREATKKKAAREG